MSLASNFLFEVGMLARTPRSGFAFLGTGAQSVAEHSFRMLHVAALLAQRSPEPVDELHLLHLVMFHDVPEARTLDHNYVARKYVAVDDEKLYADYRRDWPDGETAVELLREFEARETPVARLAYDADQLEFLLRLKEEQDLGNPRAADWISPLLQRLQTDLGRQLAQEILEGRSDEWWFAARRDPHWVHGRRPENRRDEARET